MSVDDDTLTALFRDVDLPWGAGLFDRKGDRMVSVSTWLEFAAARVPVGPRELERAADRFVARGGGRRMEQAHPLNWLRERLGRRPLPSGFSAYILPGEFFGRERYTNRDQARAFMAHRHVRTDVVLEPTEARIAALLADPDGPATDVDRAGERHVFVDPFVAFAASRGVDRAQVEAVTDAYVTRVGGRRERVRDPIAAVGDLARRVRGKPPRERMQVWTIPVH